MLSEKSQAISGVCVGTENEVMTVYPSMAGHGLGRLLGMLYESIPLKLNGVKLSHLLFPLPTSPIALVLYFHMKAFGSKYVLSNRSLQIWKSLGHQMRRQISLADIGEIDVDHAAGQGFFKAADLIVTGQDGALLLRLEGVPRAEVFREIILEARDSRLLNDAAFATIQARQPA